MTRSDAWGKVAIQVAVGDVEETLSAIADWLDLEAEAREHPESRQCVENASEHVRMAAMDFYLSTK